MPKIFKNNSGFRKDSTLRKRFKKTEHYFFAWRCLQESDFPIKTFAYLQNTAWLTKIRNRCILSGRSANIFSKIRFSRHAFRQIALFGGFPGERIY